MSSAYLQVQRKGFSALLHKSCHKKQENLMGYYTHLINVSTKALIQCN